MAQLLWGLCVPLVPLQTHRWTRLHVVPEQASLARREGLGTALPTHTAHRKSPFLGEAERPRSPFAAPTETFQIHSKPQAGGNTVQWIVRLTLGCTLLVTFRTFPSFSASFAAPLRNDLADHPTDGGLNALGFPTEPRRRGYYKARLGACLLDSDRGPHPRVDAALELVKAWSETRQLLLRTRRQ